MAKKHSSALRTIAARLNDQLNDRNKSNASAGILDQVKKLSDISSSLDKQFSSRNPNITVDAHYKNTAQSAKRLDAFAGNAQKKIAELAQLGSIDLSNQIDERLNLNETPHGAELRSVLRSMPEADRHKKIEDIINSGDGPTVAAITRAPAMLVGIDSDYQAKLNERFTMANAGDLVAKRELLHEYVSAASVSVSYAQQSADSYYDPSKLAQIEQSERQAIEASSEFNAAFRSEAVGLD